MHTLVGVLHNFIPYSVCLELSSTYACVCMFLVSRPVLSFMRALVLTFWSGSSCMHACMHMFHHSLYHWCFHSSPLGYENVTDSELN